MGIHFSSIDVTRPDYLGGAKWRLRRLNRITVLFGKNGSGKSLLLRALRDQDPESRHYVFPERAGQISFQPNWLLEQIAGQSRAQNATVNLNLNYREQVIARTQAYLAIRGSQRGTEIGTGPDELEALIQPLMTELVVEIGKDNKEYYPVTLRRMVSGETIYGAEELSSGEAQAATLALDMVTICAIWELEHTTQRLLLVDEPDTHLHPDLQQRLAHLIVEISRIYDTQILVATHSTTLLAALGHYGDADTSVIYLDNASKEQQATKIDEQFREVATCLGGHILMGPLFGAPLLLVEGDDDYRIWSQVPRHSVVKLAVIPCNGEAEVRRYQKVLERMLASIVSTGNTAHGFALLDRDVGFPQPNPTNPQRYIRFLRLTCRESENLFLTDEVLQQLGIDWDAAKEKIASESGSFGQKQQLLRAAPSWDRMETDLKTVINEVARILDSTNVPWTMRVGRCIGRSRPTGQLKEFLGQEVVEAFWPSG